MVNLFSIYVLVQRFLNYYPNYFTRRLYFGEVKIPYWGLLISERPEILETADTMFAKLSPYLSPLLDPSKHMQNYEGMEPKGCRGTNLRTRILRCRTVRWKKKMLG